MNTFIPQELGSIIKEYYNKGKPAGLCQFAGQRNPSICRGNRGKGSTANREVHPCNRNTKTVAAEINFKGGTKRIETC